MHNLIFGCGARPIPRASNHNELHRVRRRVRDREVNVARNLCTGVCGGSRIVRRPYGHGSRFRGNQFGRIEARSLQSIGNSRAIRHVQCERLLRRLVVIRAVFNGEGNAVLAFSQITRDGVIAFGACNRAARLGIGATCGCKPCGFCPGDGIRILLPIVAANRHTTQSRIDVGAVAYRLRTCRRKRNRPRRGRVRTRHAVAQLVFLNFVSAGNRDVLVAHYERVGIASSVRARFGADTRCTRGNLVTGKVIARHFSGRRRVRKRERASVRNRERERMRIAVDRYGRRQRRRALVGDETHRNRMRVRRPNRRSGDAMRRAELRIRGAGAQNLERCLRLEEVWIGGAVNLSRFAITSARIVIRANNVEARKRIACLLQLCATRQLNVAAGLQASRHRVRVFGHVSANR